MHLSGLADAVLADPTLATAMADARGGAVPRPRPHRSRGAAARSSSPGWSAPGRTVLAVTATAREAEDLVEALGDLVDPAAGRPTTRAGRRCRTSGSARAATPSAAGSPCCAGCATPATTPPTGRSKVVVAPVRSVLQPQVKGLGDLEPVELVPGDYGSARGRRTPALGRGLLPRRPGREARRVRGPRRHRRRLPADRGAPAARGVLGRRRRGDPHPSRSPTSAPSRRSSGSGRRRAASCCSPTRSASGPPSSAGSTRSCSS